MVEWLGKIYIEWKEGGREGGREGRRGYNVRETR